MVGPRTVSLKDLASNMSFRSFIRRTPSHILVYGVPNARRAMAMARSSAHISLFYADLYAVRKGHFSMRRPDDYDQPLVASTVPHRPYGHDMRSFCGIEGFRSGHL